VRLLSRPGAGPGRVWRLLAAPPENYPAKPKAEDKARAEARSLARWLAAAGPAGAGADTWSQVAVLAPRRDWLEAVERELRAAGLDAQLHTGGRAPGANPARTWLAALLGVLADPADIFERIGVLREVFGISDDELYHWRNGRAPSQNLGSALNLLDLLARQIAGQPLREAAALASSAARLPERLAVLPGPPAPGALEALLDQAALADLRGETLAAFACSLRRGPVETTEVAARPAAVQLLTNHKAKGLEWQTVIQFGLFLDPRFAPPKYPRWQPPAAPGEPPTCLYDKAHAAHAGANSSQHERDTRRAEFERLLYVAATRPRHALIMMDAEALTEKVPAGSLATILDIVDGGSARNWWNDIPELRNISAKKSSTSAQPAPQPAATLRWPQPDWNADIFADAATRATGFTRRVRPSTLARHPPAGAAARAEPDLSMPPEFPEEQPVPTAAVAYGNAWHDLMEHTPWPAGRGAWKKFWHSRFALMPDPDRARTETELLLQSELAARLAAPGLEFAVELPFLWAEPDAACAFDGCVDLAVWDGSNSRWLVVDWKTDRVDGGGAELRERYGPQIEVYARALAAMTQAPVEAFLFGTRAGELTKV
jgi:ATP-dependent exoDNAse (exonuclease V) beta subunit